MSKSKIDPNYSKEYYLKNKQRILTRLNERIFCDVCQCWICKGNQKTHIRSNKHKVRLTTPIEQPPKKKDIEFEDIDSLNNYELLLKYKKLLDKYKTLKKEHEKILIDCYNESIDH